MILDFLRQLERYKMLDTIHESSTGAVTTITGGGTTQAADSDDPGAMHESDSDFGKELEKLDKEFGGDASDSDSGKQDDKQSDASGQKPDEGGKTTEKAPAPDSKTLGENEIKVINDLSPKLLEKYPYLRQYIPGGIEKVLQNYNDNIQEMMQLRAISGRTGVPLRQLLAALEQGATGAQPAKPSDDAGKPADPPKVKELDDATAKQWADTLGLSKDQFKDFFALVRDSLVAQPDTSKIEERLQAAERTMAMTQAEASKNLWNTHYNTFVSDPAVNKVAAKIPREALERVILEYEAITPGFSQHWIDKGQNPYMKAYRLHMAEYSSPEEYLQSIGALEKTVGKVPDIQQPRGTQTQTDKQLGEMSDSELVTFIRKNLRDNSVTDLDSQGDGF